MSDAGTLANDGRVSVINDLAWKFQTLLCPKYCDVFVVLSYVFPTDRDFEDATGEWFLRIT